MSHQFAPIAWLPARDETWMWPRTLYLPGLGRHRRLPRLERRVGGTPPWGNHAED